MLERRVDLIVFAGYSYHQDDIISLPTGVWFHGVNTFACRYEFKKKKKQPHSDASGVRNKTRRQSAQCVVII